MKIQNSEIELMNEIVDIVSYYYNVNLKEDTNRNSVAKPRNVCVYLIREFTETLAIDLIAQRFNRGYSNFVTGNKRLEEEMDVNKNLAREIETLRLVIQSEAKHYNISFDSKLKLDIYKLLNRFDRQQLYTIKNNIENTVCLN